MELDLAPIQFPHQIEVVDKTTDPYSDETRVPAVPNLDALIAELHRVFSEDRVNVEYVKALMSAYRSNPADWKQYAKFDNYRYTRNLVDDGNGKFNLMALCWGEGQGSSVHDHSDAHCFVKVLAGELKETMYAWPAPDSEPGAPLQQTDVNLYPTDGVTYINDSMGLHRVENPSHVNGAVSLHLYSPPFACCMAFDERTGDSHKVCMTFWSKKGKRTPFITTE